MWNDQAGADLRGWKKRGSNAVIISNIAATREWRLKKCELFLGGRRGENRGGQRNGRRKR